MAMPKFQVGEIAIFHETDYSDHLPFIGSEGEILFIVHEEYIGNSFYYEILINGLAGKVGAIEECLRKKKPPEEGINWIEKLGLNKIKNKELENA